MGQQSSLALHGYDIGLGLLMRACAHQQTLDCSLTRTSQMQAFTPVDILWRALALFLLIGAVSGAVVALLLIFKPQQLERINQVANRWVSMRHISQWMDRTVSLERWLYRHHRPLGLFICLGAAYMLFYFGWRFERAVAVQSLAAYMPNRLLLDMLIQVLTLVAIIGALVALVVGIVMGLRPSLLRGVETGSNQWVSSRRATKVMDINRDGIDSVVLQHAQKTGWLLLLGSIYLFFVMLRWLL